MMLTGLQIIISLFAVFALSRVYLAFRKGSLSIRELIMWGIIWAGVISVVFFPAITDRIFGFMGLERGIDTLLYLSVVFLFYSLYRVYAKIERLEQEITGIVREMALRPGGVLKENQLKKINKKVWEDGKKED